MKAMLTTPNANKVPPCVGVGNVGCLETWALLDRDDSDCPQAVLQTQSLGWPGINKPSS